MKTIKIRRVGDELPVTLPGEMLADLGLGEGDEIVAKAGDRMIELFAPEPDVERALEIARRGAKKYRNALAEPYGFPVRPSRSFTKSGSRSMVGLRGYVTPGCWNRRSRGG